MKIIEFVALKTSISYDRLNYMVITLKWFSLPRKYNQKNSWGQLVSKNICNHGSIVNKNFAKEQKSVLNLISNFCSECDQYSLDAIVSIINPWLLIFSWESRQFLVVFLSQSDDLEIYLNLFHFHSWQYPTKLFCIMRI